MKRSLEPGESSAISPPPMRQYRRHVLLAPLGLGDLRLPPRVVAGALTSALQTSPSFDVCVCEHSASPKVVAPAMAELAPSDIDDSSERRLLRYRPADHGRLGDVLSSRPAVLVVECNWRLAPNSNKVRGRNHELCHKRHSNHLPSSCCFPAAAAAAALRRGAQGFGRSRERCYR